MNKRIYGVIGIRSIMANWNADFTGYPKTTSTGEVFGSDKALKYPMKKLWESQGKRVLYVKSYTLSEDKKKEEKNVIPRTLKERYEQLFECEDLSKIKDNQIVIKNLFTAVDVKNFGATFAEAGKNFSIIGAVQIGQGFNKYDLTEAQEQAILSPFRDPSDAEAKNSTIGTKIVSNEAHYFYPFVINPRAYDEYVSLGFTEGYTEEDYACCKEAALIGATSFNSNSKMGCENEFALFIETEEELYLPDLAQYITFEKESGKEIIKLGFTELLLEVKDKIQKIEIYYNPYKTTLEGKVENAHYYNLYTKEEMSL